MNWINIVDLTKRCNDC